MSYSSNTYMQLQRRSHVEPGPGPGPRHQQLHNSEQSGRNTLIEHAMQSDRNTAVQVNACSWWKTYLLFGL